MVFEKKVIIGSIMSFIATAVGVIAIFFPDLFNLQKDRMEKIEMTIDSRQNAEKFSEFIREREKDGKVFEVNIKLPMKIPYDQYRNEQNDEIWQSNKDSAKKVELYDPKEFYGFSYFDSIDRNATDKEEMEIVINKKSGQEENFEYDENLHCFSAMDDHCAGTTFYFPYKRVHIDFKGYQDFSPETIVELKGYFLVDQDKTEYFGDEIDQMRFYFHDIPKEQVLLKNY